MTSQFKKIVVVVTLSALSFPSYAGVEPNEPDATKVQPSIDAPQREITQNVVSQEIRSAAQVEAELGKEYYRDCVQTLKWALGMIVTLLIVFVGYAAYKRGQEYKEVLADIRQALGDAKEACKEARTASDKAREYEEKARERLSSLDEATGKKLKEIEDKGKTLITNLIQEAEKQREASREEAGRLRKISELWNEGLRAAKAEEFELAAKSFSQIVKDLNFENELVYNNWGNALCELAKHKEGAEFEELFRASFEKYEKAVQIKPDFHEAYSNWGNALSDLAKRKEGAESEAFFRASCEKYEKAVQIKPDFHEAYNNWGIALNYLAKRKDGAEAGTLFRASFEKYDKAVRIKPDKYQTYANWGIALGELAKCKDGAEAEALFRASFEKFDKAIQIKPDNHEAFNNWGVALCELAERKVGTESEILFRTSFEKYEKAIQIKPDFSEAFNNWSKALLDLAKKKGGEDRVKILEEAKRICLEAKSINKDSLAYNIACANALLGNEAECRKWLEVSAHSGNLPVGIHAMSDPDLESVRDKDWFQQIPWPDKAK